MTLKAARDCINVYDSSELLPVRNMHVFACSFQSRTIDSQERFTAWCSYNQLKLRKMHFVEDYEASNTTMNPERRYGVEWWPETHQTVKSTFFDKISSLPSFSCLRHFAWGGVLIHSKRTFVPKIKKSPNFKLWTNMTNRWTIDPNNHRMPSLWFTVCTWP